MRHWLVAWLLSGQARSNRCRCSWAAHRWIAKRESASPRGGLQVVLPLSNRLARPASLVQISGDGLELALATEEDGVAWVGVWPEELCDITSLRQPSQDAGKGAKPN